MRTSITLVWTVLLLSGGSRVEAQDDTYRRLAEGATRAMSEHRVEDALTIFREMHAMQPSARTLWSLGRVHHEMGRYVLAMSYLDQALVDPRRPLDAEQRQQATELRARAEALTGVLELTVDPADAIVLIDDVELSGVGESSFPGMLRRGEQVQVTNGEQRSRMTFQLRLDAGDHVVRVERQGREPSIRRVPIRPGERARAEIVDISAARPADTSSAVVGNGAPMVEGGLEFVPPVQGPDVRLVVRLAQGVEGPLVLSLQPVTTMGAVTPIGEREVVCEAPCEVRHARGTYSASVSRAGGGDAYALSLVPLTIDTQLVLNYRDESATRISGAITTTLVAGYGVLATILGSIALGIDSGDSFREVISPTAGGILLGTGISAALLGLLGLGFAFQVDWLEVSLAPM
jgi:hypothetical protein